MANTGWTWDEAGTLTIPRLRALMRQWAQNPPTHILMKARMGYQAPAQPQPQAPANDSTADGAPAWLAGLGGGIPASSAVSEATTTADTLAAFERQFFGQLAEVPHHGR